jgi:RNA polymerase sigma-70 factor (ECF subfamily)
MMNWFNRRGENKKSYSTNQEWMQALTPPPEEEAITKLRIYLVKGLKAALYKNVDRGLESFVEDIAQDSLLKILDNLNSFRGESKFTTWAMKIAVREGYTELRKKRYEDISIQDYSHPGKPDGGAADIPRDEAGPDRIAHESIAVEKVMAAMKEELTQKQRQVIQLLMVEQIPMTVVAERLNSNRNAIYKLVHDARVRLKERLNKEGINPEELLKSM